MGRIMALDPKWLGPKFWPFAGNMGGALGGPSLAVRVVAAVALAVILVGGGFLIVLLIRGAEPARQAVATTAAPTGAAAPGPAAAKPPATIVDAQTIGDWGYACTVESGAKRCSLTQRLNDSKTRSPIFAWVMTQDGNGAIIGTWQTPTGVLVGRGITIDAGNGKPIAIPYNACATGQCEAVAGLATDFLDLIGQTDKLTATIYATSGQGISFTLSVKGLKDGIAKLRST